MPNLLVVPFKQSYKAPVKQALREYIHASTNQHPEEFKWDVDRWDTLREESRGIAPHVDLIDKMIRFGFFVFAFTRNLWVDIDSYHAQLVFVLTKLPTDVSPSSGHFRCAQLGTHLLFR